MPEHAACIDTLMHDDGSCRHAHTDHTANGEVCTGKEDQPRNTQGKKHTRRCPLKNIQHIIISKKRCIFYHRCNNTQCDKYEYDGNIQTVLQEKSPAVECILIVLPLLGSRLQQSES